MIKKLSLFLGLLLFCSLPAQRKMKDYNNVIKSNSIYEIDAFLRDAHPDDPRRSVLKPRLMNLLRDYIKKAFPEDPRVKEMQEKLALLKRRPSTKITFDEMNANIKEKQIKFYKEELERAKRLAANPQLAKKPMRASTPRDESLGKASGSESELSKMISIAEARKAAAKTGTSASLAHLENPEQAEFDLLMNPTAEDHKNQTVKILNALFDNDPTSKETTVMIRNSSDCNIIMRMEGTGHLKYRLAIPAKSENTIVIPKGQYLFSSLVCGAQYASQKTVEKAIIVTLGNPGR